MKPKKWSLTSKLAFLFILMLVAVVPTVSHGAIINVNSFVDGVAANPGGGVCQTAPGNGICTLRAAIQVANAVGGLDTINLPAGTYTLSIPGLNENAAAQGDLDITGLGGPLEIIGAGAATTIIDGGALDGVFDLIFAGGQGANATISGVTIRNGNGDPVRGLGGGINVNTGTTLTLKNSVVTGCKAFGAAAGASGIDNSGTLHMDTVAVTNNDGPGGGVNNGAAGVLDWIHGEVSGNKNTDVNAGGGGIQNNGTITLTNITISGNNSSGQGAGIDARGTVTLLNATISNNISSAGVAAVGGIRNNAAVSITARNTILSGNSVNNCGGTITSQGNNLDSANSCAFAGPGDLINTDPKLATLLDVNGSVLQPALNTRALLPGSPAIDAGSATVCPAFDARGISRPVDGNPTPPAVTAICDMGAYEFRPQKITATPALSFDFGSVLTGSILDTQVTLTNIGDGALIIGTLAVTDPLLAPFSIPAAPLDLCSGKSLPLAGTCTFTARFAPTAVGAATDIFDIPSNDPILPAISFALSGTGSAVPVPGISVTDTIAPLNDNTVPFGGVTAGSSADATITVTNTGTANLVIGTIASANPLALPFSILNDTCSGKTVAPAATCTLTVHFAPTLNGPFSDTFDIPSTGLPTETVNVSGTGGTATTGTGTVNSPPPNPVLFTPANGQTGVPTTMTFTWKKSVDPNGDAVTYHVIYSTDPSFATSQTVDVAAAKAAGLLFAGLGSMGGGIILFGFVSGSGMKRSRKLLIVIPVLLLMGTLFTACGGGGGGTPSTTTPPGAPPGTTAADVASTTVTGLAANTTYFWKVVADDGKGLLSTSETFSFKTQ